MIMITGGCVCVRVCEGDEDKAEGDMCVKVGTMSP